jgi:polar amino acid transport system substrate-binding protein
VFPSAAVVESVHSGRADIAAGGWYATEEWGKIVGQSDPVYVELPTLVAKDRVSNLNDLSGKTVGTITGYSWVDEARAVFGDDLKLYQSPDAVIADLRSGRIDAGLVGGIDGPFLVKESGKNDLVSTTMDPDPRIRSSVIPSLPNYPHTKHEPQADRGHQRRTRRAALRRLHRRRP